jgi:hypothetical protein
MPLTAKAQSILRGLRQDAPDDELIFDPKRTAESAGTYSTALSEPSRMRGWTTFTSTTYAGRSPRACARQACTLMTSQTF